MPFVRRFGGGQFESAADIAKVSRVTRKVDPITYTANTTVIKELDRFNVLGYLSLLLTGTMAVGTAAGTTLLNFPDNYIGGLIKWINIRVNGQFIVHRIPGFMLGALTRVYYDGAVPQKTDTGKTVANHTVAMHYMIPFDVGGYLSPFDGTRANRITVEVEWGDEEDCITKDSGTTLAFTGQLDVTQYCVQGFDVGRQGGPGFPYPIHHLIGSQYDITATKSDYLIRLDPNRTYTGFMFAGMKSGPVPDSAALTNAKVRIGNSDVIDVTAAEMNAQMKLRYRLLDNGTTSTNWAGLWVLDPADPAHFEQSVVVGDRTNLDLILSVAATNSPTLTVLADYLEAAPRSF